MFLISKLGETATKSVIEMNGQPRLPSTTHCGRKNEERENRPWPDDTGEIIYGEGKK